MNRKFAFVLVALAALALFAAGLDAQCSGCPGSAKKAQQCGAGDGQVAVAAAESGTVSTGALVALLRAKAPMTLIDARGEAEDAIPGARCLSDDGVACGTTLAKVVGAKDRLVVTYCAGPKCPASSKMAAKLRAAGYANVVEYREGAAGWKNMKSAAAKCGSACGAAKSCGDAGSCGAAKSCGDAGSCGASSPAGVAGADAASVPASVVDSNGLRTLMQAKVPMVVLDARSGKWDDGNRIPGAIAFNCDGCMGKSEAMQKVLRSKDQLIVTYCGAEACPLSSMLSKKLRAAGYANVIEYKAGISGWKNAGFETLQQKASCCGSCGDQATKSQCGDQGSCGDQAKKSQCGDQGSCGDQAKKSQCGDRGSCGDAAKKVGCGSR